MLPVSSRSADDALGLLCAEAGQGTAAPYRDVTAVTKARVSLTSNKNDTKTARLAGAYAISLRECRMVLVPVLKAKRRAVR